MRVFLVRHHEKKTILGLFWDENLKDLWWNVDSITDPSDYEYAVLAGGNLHFPDEEPLPRSLTEMVNSEDEDEDGNSISWAAAQSDLSLDDALDSPENFRWKRFPYADEPGGGAFEAVAMADRQRLEEDA